MYENTVKAYQQTQYSTAKPIRLVILCYDAAIGSLKLVREHYVAKDYEAKAKALQKAQAFIYEMNASLNLEKGGDIAKNLRSLYEYMLKRLIEADLKKDIGIFDEVIRMLEELQSAWMEIARGDVAEAGPVLHKIPVASERTASASQLWSA